MHYYIGVDIGGTKCAVSLGCERDGKPEIVEKIRFSTPDGPQKGVAELAKAAKTLAEKAPGGVTAAGISCGGPLSSKKGLLLSPPNLPGWDEVDIVTPIREATGAPTFLQNDANACALAEWHWGAGRGSQNMVFLTFGTGMGAGLIIDGRLLSGLTDSAGEVGHLRLAEDGPEGYRKRGSFEGFCSGGGIARLAQMRLPDYLAGGKKTLLTDTTPITAQAVGEAAALKDEFALGIMQTTGYYLGQGISLLIDILNPEVIVIGSIYLRQQALLEPIIKEVIAKEALPHAAAVCRIVPAGLGEQVGDFAGLSVALG